MSKSIADEAWVGVLPESKERATSSPVTTVFIEGTFTAIFGIVLAASIESM